jgi:hypothetical protein
LRSDAGLRHGKICDSVLIESPFREAFADNLQLAIIGIDNVTLSEAPFGGYRPEQPLYYEGELHQLVLAGRKGPNASAHVRRRRSQASFGDEGPDTHQVSDNNETSRHWTAYVSASLPWVLYLFWSIGSHVMCRLPSEKQRGFVQGRRSAPLACR